MLVSALLFTVLTFGMSSQDAAYGAGAKRSEQVCAAAQAEPLPFGFERPIIIGEFHGTEQTEPLVIAIICQALEKGHTVTFAVEVPPTALGEASGSAESDAFWTGPADGRSSVSMHRLLEQLSPLQVDGSLKIVGFRLQVPWAQLGAASAGYIRQQARESDVVVVLAGNFHAARAASEEEVQTLATAIGDSVNVRIANSRPGTAWACVPACGIQTLPGGSGPLPLGFNRVSAANGYDYFYVVDTYTASLPYRERVSVSP